MVARADIIKKVKVKLEELSPFDEPTDMLAIPNNDVKPIHSYIEDTLDKSFDDVLLSVPLHAIRETFTDYKPTFSVDSEGVGLCAVPDDFLRVYTILFPEWRRAVNAHITPTNAAAYFLQRNKYTRGKFEKPIVAINDGNFEIYSLKNMPERGKYIFRYIPRTAVNTQQFEENLVEYLVLQNAIHILEIFEQYDKVKILSEELANKIKVISI